MACVLDHRTDHLGFGLQGIASVAQGSHHARTDFRDEKYGSWGSSWPTRRVGRASKLARPGFSQDSDAQNSGLECTSANHVRLQERASQATLKRSKAHPCSNDFRYVFAILKALQPIEAVRPDNRPTGMRFPISTHCRAPAKRPSICFA